MMFVKPSRRRRSPPPQRKTLAPTMGREAVELTSEARGTLTTDVGTGPSEPTHGHERVVDDRRRTPQNQTCARAHLKRELPRVADDVDRRGQHRMRFVRDPSGLPWPRWGEVGDNPYGRYRIGPNECAESRSGKNSSRPAGSRAQAVTTERLPWSGPHREDRARLPVPWPPPRKTFGPSAAPPIG